MGSEHLLWRPQITLLLIEPWSERMRETHGRPSPLWPSPHNIWKQEDSGHSRRGLEERLVWLSSVAQTFIKPVSNTRPARSTWVEFGASQKPEGPEPVQPVAPEYSILVILFPIWCAHYILFLCCKTGPATIQAFELFVVSHAWVRGILRHCTEYSHKSSKSSMASDLSETSVAQS